MIHLAQGIAILVLLVIFIALVVGWRRKWISRQKFRLAVRVLIAAELVLIVTLLLTFPVP